MHIDFRVKNVNLKWEDHWVGNEPLACSSWDIYAVSSKKKKFVISDCWNNDHQAWDLGWKEGFLIGGEELGGFSQ